MGRPEPCVLFAQTFVHPQLDEYVDEVLFSEPVVISACEFLEQNASSTCSALELIGATSPPSFAMEVFVQCEGEARFRRLCQPFLYSHSSSNVLEVEAVVTNHLVVRGSYRSLSLVIYGNTAEDLGQFNIEVELDNSLANTGSTVEGNLEDLPPALCPTNVTIQEDLSPLRSLSLKLPWLDIPVDMKQFLQLTLKILDSQNLGHITNRLLSSILSVASVYANSCLHSGVNIHKQLGLDKLIHDSGISDVLIEARKELCEIYKDLYCQSGDELAEFSTEGLCTVLGEDVPSTEQLVDALSHYFKYDRGICSEGSKFSKKENTILSLALALILCSARESCFHFVNYGGMEQLGNAFSHYMQNSTALKLMLLGVIEQATQHSVGCEGFLGWWPREDESRPSRKSEGYNQLLNLLLKNQRHDVALLSTYILHRIRFYEVASRYEHAVLSILEGLRVGSQVKSDAVDLLANAKLQLRKLLKLINSCGPIEDPSPVACASRSLLLGDAGQLSYKSTSGLILLSSCCYPNRDVDTHLLSLLKERGFLPLSAALLSSSALRTEKGGMLDIFVDIMSYLEAIILSLISCRSGLVFLASNPELSTTIIHALRGTFNSKKEESVCLRYASALISKGFFCHPHKIAMIMDMHLKAINAVDLLVTSHRNSTSNLNSEDFLWILWKLCGLSRSEGGREALLASVHFPEVVSVLLATLHSAKESDPSSLNNVASPLNHAIFHSAAEIFETIVSDSTASSLASWIEHVKELHKLLLSSSPGSNKKDAPARLLDWIDAGVVYNRSGAIGLLRYVAVLASGGDAHMASTSVLASDVMDVDNFIGDSSNTSDGNLIDNILGKRITEKDFPGVILRDSSVVQLTTAVRILAFISDNPTVAAALYDEGAVMVVHAVLINCRLMLERSSNVYDYLVDEGTECNSTSDILLERSREQSLIDLLIPSLVLLINVLQKLQEAKEQHRNTKLINSLVQLHREVSPKLAACASDLSYPCPKLALGFGAVCHLLVSALACWSVYGWTPGLFHFLLDNLNATSVLALGPKETCSLFCLLNDLFPDECIWLWKDGMPVLATHRTLAVRTLLGPWKEEQINWYLQSGHREKLLAQLTPQLGKIAEIVLHCCVSTLIVVQDMIRVFITRITCLSADNASVLVRPIVLKIHNLLSDCSILSEMDVYKVHRLLAFFSLLLEHPQAKKIMLKGGAVQMLSQVLQRCLTAANFDPKVFLENRNVNGKVTSVVGWLPPVFKCISLICDFREHGRSISLPERHIPEAFTAEECILVLTYLLTYCKILPVGKELLSCLSSFKELGRLARGKSSLLSIFQHIQFSNEDSKSVSQSVNVHDIINTFDWKDYPPLEHCWRMLLSSITSNHVPLAYTIEAVGTLSLGSLYFCMDEDSVNLERVEAIRYLFGFKNQSGPLTLYEESIKCLESYSCSFGSMGNDAYSLGFDQDYLNHVMESAKSLMLLLHEPSGEVKENEIASIVSTASIGPTVSSKIHRLVDGGAERLEDDSLDELGDHFLWECPENLRDRLTQSGLASKRKSSTMEGSSRRGRGDASSAEAATPGSFSRGSAPPSVASGPTRRDTFRQRKPNTSRPPSMHVDDYVARERNADGSSSNVIAVPRIGSSSGRPPSIHVDEFMARQRERQNSIGSPVIDVATQEKVAPVVNKAADVEKSTVSRPLKPDLDDDLQGIDIVFDAEESEPEDKLPFPQPDDHLQQPAPVIVEQNSPHSIVEETASEVNDTRQSSRVGYTRVSNPDENVQSEFSSRMSVSHPEMKLIREPSVSSDRKFPDLSEEPRSSSVKISSGFDSLAKAATTSAFTQAPASSLHAPADTHSPATMYPRGNAQQNPAIVSQGYYDQKSQPNHGPSPLSNPSPVFSHPVDHTVQPDYFSMQMSTSGSLTSSPLPDSKYARTAGGPTRPFPPLPPTPPPFAVNPTNFPALKHSASQSPVYNPTELQQASSSVPVLSTLSPPPLVPPMVFNRPSSIPVNPFGNSSAPHHVDNIPSNTQNLPASLPPIHSLQSITQLQPLQPPQLPRPPSQHLRPFIPGSMQSDQGLSLLQQNRMHAQMQQPLQMLHQPQPSPAQAYYQTQKQESVSHSLPQQQLQHQQPQHVHVMPQGQHNQGDTGSQQLDSSMSLQDFFKSPEAIQSLLSDRDKLCQLLEQHPKLMQMLQERLGQL